MPEKGAQRSHRRRVLHAISTAVLEDPDGFWLEEARGSTDQAFPGSRSQLRDEAFGIRWFEDGTLNLAANCLDRHLAARGDQTAIVWEPDDPAQPVRTLTYRQLHAATCKFANLLKAEGVRNGDRVTIYLPMVPEAAIAMLACARIGAVHSIVFAGFSPEALGSRIVGLRQRPVITPTKACAAASASAQGQRRRRARQPRQSPPRDRAQAHRRRRPMVAGATSTGPRPSPTSPPTAPRKK